jgi:hypothetical protein
MDNVQKHNILIIYHLHKLLDLIGLYCFYMISEIHRVKVQKFRIKRPH